MVSNWTVYQLDINDFLWIGTFVFDSDSGTTRRTLLAAVAGGSALSGCMEGTSDEADTDTTAATDVETTGEDATTTAPSINAEQASREFLEQLTSAEYSQAAAHIASDYVTFPTQAVTLLSGLDTNERTLERFLTVFESEHGMFEGIGDVSAGDDSATATATLDFAESSQQARIDFNTDGKIGRIEFPSEYTLPDYADPDAYREQELSIDADDHELGGTLTVPADTNTPVPGVVLVQAAGIYTRDAEFGPNKFHRDLAVGLASMGIASYRFDRRPLASLSTAQRDIDRLFVDDAVTACETLADHEAVDTDRISVAGHSVGGEVAPRIAANYKQLNGIVLLDAFSLPISQQASMSRESLQDADWYTEKEKKLIESIQQARAQLPEKDFDDDAQNVAGRSGAYWNSLLEYDPLDTATNVSADIFVIQNGRTLAPATASFELWQETLDSSQAQFQMFESHNHYHQSGNQKSLPSAIGRFHDNVAEDTVTAVADWVGSAPR